MKILIACDMEGITGVVHWNQVDSSHAEYPRFRRLMTADVNAAIRGALDAGAGSVLVVDGHGNNNNILIEELDPRATFYAGSVPPFTMVQGVESGVAAAMFVGYHARIGAPDAILGHTWAASRVANVWLNGQLIGEIGINAALCGHYEVPVVMISGDGTACAEATDLLGPVETAVVKRAHGNMAAECLSPAAAQEAIYAAARRAVIRLQAGQTPPPYRPAAPTAMAVEFHQVEMAARAAAVPGVQWDGRRRIEFAAPDMPAAFRCFWATVMLART